MNSDLSRGDERLLDRFLDGTLSPGEVASCQRRLEGEPLLRAALRDRTRLRRGFAAGRGTAFAAPAGFAARVVAAARRLPPAADDPESADVVRFCRRVLLAAAIVVAATLLWHSGLFASPGDGTLQAAPDEIDRVIDALDAKIRAGETGPK
jgi:hypothetical protein